MSKEAKQCTDLHDRAMAISDKAFVAEKKGKPEKGIKKIYTQAFELEKKAAMILKDKTEIEPSRSVLFRSAAWLAVKAGEYREAERMAAFGLSGNPPKMILDELREVQETISLKIKESNLAEAA